VGQYFGNYQLVKLLGQGSYARVYLGKHRYLKSYAALKVSNAVIRPRDEQTFLAEAQTLVGLRHANIIHLLDFGIEDGIPVLIMDYAPNGSLRQQYPDGTQVPLPTVVDIVTQIAAALQYAHNHHVIHCDVKPENVLLDANTHLLLSDFGLSLLTPSSQPLSTQDPAGTPRYMAPEQLRGKPCFASDQYALAVMVYEWLCGTLPFRGTMWEIWQQHMYTPPPPLCPLRPELSLRLEHIVHRALAKQPQDRFVSVLAFARAFAQASQDATPIDEDDEQATDHLQDTPYAPPLTPRALTLSSQTGETQTRAQLLQTTQQTSAVVVQKQNRLRMLRRLRHSYSELMSQSLQGAAWLDLGIAFKPDAVQNAAHLLFHLPHRAEQELPPGTSIAQAYDEAEHELLILGEPGAGKSTLLLNLAQQLVMRAEQDKTHPLPIILPLSSWAIKHLKLEDWMAEQLTQIYDIPHKVSARWVQEDGILPLLDGLDEMEETASAACIAAINAFHHDHIVPLVVSSRTTEYETAAGAHRLLLQGAVVVQPFTWERVHAYLVRAGEPLTALRSVLEKNAALQDLATTPLMLNILILTYHGASVQDLSNKESLLQKLVWDDYVQRMVERKGNKKRYPLERTWAWLSYLARQMREKNQTLFYLERLQPDWLTAQQQRSYAWRAVGLPAIFIGVLMGFLVELFFFGGTQFSDLGTCLQYGLQGGFLGGIWYEVVSKRESQGEQPRQWGKRLVKRLAINACIGVIGGLAHGLHLSSSFYHYSPALVQAETISYGVATGVTYLLLHYLLTARFHLTMFAGHSASQRWQRVMRFGAAVQGSRVLAMAGVIGVSVALSLGPLYGPSAGLSVALTAGLICVLTNLALNTQMENIRPTERLTWTWKSLRRGLFNSKHLPITLLLTSISIIFFGPSNGLSVGLRIGLSYWFLIGLFQGVAQGRIENRDRRVANQGIHRSLRNGVIMGIIGGTIIGILGTLSYRLTLWLNDVLSYKLIPGLSYGLKLELVFGPSEMLNYGFGLGVYGALLIFLLTGGLAVLRHFSIRLLLWRSHTFPWQAPQFLDDATARFLLRRVGGGYSFTHRLLLDHLADGEGGDVADVSTQILHP
jgi:serine/threonine protein kinase